MSVDPTSNVIRLADFRHGQERQGLHLVRPDSSCGGDKDTVFFVTGGRFECTINNVTGVLRTGEFVRVPNDASFVCRSIGQFRGTVLSHRFAKSIPSGFLRELALALPPFSETLPRRDSADFAALLRIARRWGVVLDSETAA